MAACVTLTRRNTPTQAWGAGGGGNFGVVTSFEFQLFPSPARSRPAKSSSRSLGP
jgi:FAD/FMN-containing dehydrogenase